MDSLWSSSLAALDCLTVEESAKLFGVAPGQCTAQNGAFVSGDKSISYAKLIERGDLSRTLTADVLARIPVEPASARRLIGRPHPPLGIRPKPTARRAPAWTRTSRAWSMR
jgi:isoquinoline 1-oxidoreductase subunit beta